MKRKQVDVDLNAGKMETRRGTSTGRGKRGQKKDKNEIGISRTPRTRKCTQVTDKVTPVPDRRPSALQILSKETKKRRTRSSSSPLPPDNLPPKSGPAPASVKLKRLRKKPIKIETPPVKTRIERCEGPSSSSNPAVIRRRGCARRQKHDVCPLDIPALSSQLSTFPKIDQIKTEVISPGPSPPPAPSPPSPSQFMKEEPYSTTQEGDYQYIPVPLPRQRDVVLPSPSNIQPINTDTGSVKVPRVPYAYILPKTTLSYQDMISQQEEEALNEQRRVQLATCERLKNILKLPKAHNWVIYEWFYSDIDRALFGGDNDFEACLRECYPSLKVRQMTRVDWVKIRGTMGKPRRLSVRFFEEERQQLALKREKVRQIQRRNKVAIDWGNVRFLPEEIPMMLSIGTRVTARVRGAHDGIFQGTVEGVDTSNNTYRIFFGRAGLMIGSIPDYEVRAQIPPDTISTQSFFIKIPRQGSSQDALKFKFRNATLLQEKLAEELPKSPFSVDSMLGGFPVRCLELIVRQSKLLKEKKSKLGELSELNVEAEKMRTYGRAYPEEYRKRYALCIAELGKINEGLEKIMQVIKVYMKEIAGDAIDDSSTHGPGGTCSPSSGKMVYPEKVKETADKEAKDIVTTYNFPDRVNSPKIKTLVQNVASVMLQARALGTENGGRLPFELESLRETVGNMRKSLEGKNLKTFQDNVDIPIQRIMAGLCVDRKVGDYEIN